MPGRHTEKINNRGLAPIIKLKLELCYLEFNLEARRFLLSRDRRFFVTGGQTNSNLLASIDPRTAVLTDTI